MIHWNSIDWKLIQGYLGLIFELLFYSLLAFCIFKLTVKSNERDPKVYYGFLLNFAQTPDSVIIWKWLKDNTSDSNGQRYKSIKEIAEACSRNCEQVRRGCFSNPQIYQLKDTREEMWTIYPDESARETPYFR